MGQKIHPTGFRLAVTRDWSSRWFASSRDYSKMLHEDIKVRDFLKKKLPLPSDTPIDLTLDTTWNANQIVSDLMEYARRGETPHSAP